MEINFSTTPTMHAIDEALEKSQETKPRPYLGMSAIGDPCARRLWHGFRWAAMRHIKARGLCAIEDGHRGEDLMAERLRLVAGIELHTVGADGRQFGFVAVNGHFKGHMDGAIRGVLEAPKSWSVWEHKQTNEKKFNDLKSKVIEHGEKEALKHWDEIYYAQAVCYMEMTGMERHFLTCATPGGRDYTSVRTNANPKYAKALLEKAERIINATTPPERLSNDPNFYQCRWCPFIDICHNDAAPLPNCRTCAHAKPVDDGKWACTYHNKNITYNDQLKGCDDHRYLPTMLNFAEPIDGSQADNWVKYRHKETGKEFYNGGPGFASREIYAVRDKRALDGGDAFINEIKSKFNGELIE